MYYILDTNIWREMAHENKNVISYISSLDGELCATTVTLFELLSNISESNFDSRKKAAQVIIDKATLFIKSPEHVLASYFGANGGEEDIDYKEGFIGIANARSIQDLINGYNDSKAKVRRKFDISLLLNWRNHHYEDFKMKMTEAIESVLPGYKDYVENNVKRRAKISKDDLKEFDSQEFYDEAMRGVLYRANLASNGDTPSTLVETSKVENYIKVYISYLKKLAIQGAKPDVNDLGDHDQFLYLQDENWKLITTDKRWNTIARDAELDCVIRMEV